MLKIFTTGGTFDKVYYDAKSDYRIGEPYINKILEEGNVNIKYDIESILKKDSLDMTDEDRKNIFLKVKNCNEKHIMLIHGTDTMVETAIMLSDIKEKTVVLTGAMQPARFRVTDAIFNVGFAIAATLELADGIYIAMNGQIFPYNNVRKNIKQGCFEKI
jgi:L-asparaginase